MLWPQLDADAPDAAAKLRGYVALYTDVLSADRMCLCGMLAAEHRTLPDVLQQAVSVFFGASTRWLRRVVQKGCADGSLGCPGTADATASILLSALEGARLITRLDGHVTAMANELLDGLVTTHAWAPTQQQGGHPLIDDPPLTMRDQVDESDPSET